MKITNLDIFGFGKIINKSYNLKLDISTIFNENGYGKTTILNFIYAMFYGMKTIRGTKEDSLRAKYMPLSSNIFGGAMTIEDCGDIYRIERRFDKKSETKDTLKFLKNHERIEDVIPGLYLLKLDSVSYLKTLYMSDFDDSFQVPKELNEKILTLYNTSPFETSYILAKEKLESKIKLLIGDRTKESDLNKLRLNKSNLTKEKANIYSNLKDLSELNNNLSYLTKEKEKYEAKKESILNTDLVLAKQSTYNIYKTDYDNLNLSYNNLKSKYKKGIPDLEYQKDLRLLFKAKSDLEQELRFKSLSKDKKEKLDNLKTRVDEINNDLTKAKNSENELRVLDETLSKEHYTLSDTDKDVLATFQNKQLNEEDFNKYQKELLDYDNLTQVIEIEKKKEDNSNKSKYKNKVILDICLITMFILFSALSFFLFFSYKNNNNEKLLNYIFLGVGFGFLVISIIFVFRIIKLKNKIIKLKNNNINILELIDRKKQIEEDLRKLTTNYGIYTDNFVADFNLLKIKYQRYKNIKEEYLSLDSATLAESRNNLLNYLESLRDKYQISPSILVSDHLSNLVNNYNYLKNEENDSITSINDINNKLKELENSIDDALNQYDLKPNDNVEQFFLELKTDYNNFLQLKSDLKSKENELNEFKSKNNELLNLTIDKTISKDEIDLKLNELTSSIEKLNLEIKNQNEFLNRIKDIDLEIKAIDNKLEDLVTIAKVYQDTLKCLNQANLNITSKYIKPIEDNFNYYKDILEFSIGKKVSIDSNFNLRFEIEGQEVSENYLSMGEKMICLFVLRLSFLKELYKDNIPFIILDDPFQSLDDKHLNCVKDIFNKLKLNTQIIYITCHSSRILDENSLIA